MGHMNDIYLSKVPATSGWRDLVVLQNSSYLQNPLNDSSNAAAPRNPRTRRRRVRLRERRKTHGPPIAGRTGARASKHDLVGRLVTNKAQVCTSALRGLRSNW